MSTDKERFDSICYKKNFLSEVIARVDLISPIEIFEKSLPSDITGIIRPLFPVPEPRKVIDFPLQVSSNGEQIKKTKKKAEHMEWRFHGKDEEKTLTITPASIFIQYRAYKTFEKLRDDFLRIVSVVFEKYKDAQGKRLGLRYINDVVLKEDKPLEWGDYLNNNLLCSFQFYKTSGIPSRIFNNIELNFDDFNLRYQFGMHNPDYPAPIKLKSFILDLDAYCQGFQDLDEIKENLDKYHNKIQEIFESSITDELRNILNEG